MDLAIVLLNGDGMGHAYALHGAAPCTIGRDESCTIPINDKAASKQHAVITLANGSLSVKDLSSRNGTFVNGQRITTQSLVDGDTITVGMSVFKVMMADSLDITSMMNNNSKTSQIIGIPAPIHHPAVYSSPLLVEYTHQVQDLLNKYTGTIVKESLKAMFHILPVSRLSVFNVGDDNSLTQGYTVMRRANAATAHMSHSFARKVLEAGREIMIEDTSTPGDTNNQSASIGFQNVHSIIGMPVRIQGKSKVILLGDNLEHPNIFTNEHLRIMRFAGKVIEVLYQLDAVYKLDNIGNFLPICASCKKIRDDQGYWNQLEAFISERASVKFSHGYCPECAEKALKELNLQDA